MQEPAPTDATQPPATSNRRALFIVFLVVVVDLLGFGIVMPLTPVFVVDFAGTILPGGTDDPLVGVIVGSLMASFSLMQFIFAPIWGRISDRVGRRPILLLGLGGSVLFYLLFGYALTLPKETSATLALVLLFAARVGAGMAGATISTAQAVIADSTPPDKRKHGMALIGAAFGIGFTFGPLFGYAALVWFPDTPGIVGFAAAALSLLALVLGLRLLPETRNFGDAPADRRWINWSGVRFALGSGALAPVILVFFLATFGFGAFEATLALLLVDVVALTPDGAFLVFAYVGLVLLLTQGILYRRLARRMSEVTFITIGIVLMAVGVGGLGGVSLLARSSEDLIVLMLGLLFIALTTAVMGFAFLTPSAHALISRRTSADRQGEILGVNQSASAMARILGPAIGMPLYKLTDTHLLPYALGAGLLLLMLPLIPRIRRG